jgi:flagellar motor switch/type III secretory pathway protein FliN
MPSPDIIRDATDGPQGGTIDALAVADSRKIRALPAYARSLLRIQVPVVVTLATTKQTVGRILELGPGTMLHFDKPYDEPLKLSVGRCEVAVGEAVKVGEKFGLRIASMVLPAEKFEAVRPKS